MVYPKSARVLSPYPAPVAQSGAARPPASVSHAEFIEAMKPLLALVGVDETTVFAAGFFVTQGEIRFISATPVPDVEPIVIGPKGEPEFQEYGWPVSVAVRF